MTKDGNFTVFIGMGKPTFPVPVHFLALGEELVKRGHQVHLLMHHHHKIEEHQGNPSIHYWPWRDGIRRFLDIFFLLRLLIKHKPDCVIAGHRETSLLLLIAMVLKVPVRAIYYHTLSTQIDLDTRRRKWIMTLHRLSRIPLYRWVATDVIGVSSEAIRDVIQSFRAPPQKCTLLHNTLPEPNGTISIESTLQGNVEERLLCVGRLDKSKGQDVLIQAVRLLEKKFPRIKLTFVGDGPYKEEFLKLCRALQLTQRCIFVGKKQHAEILPLMKSASIVICPSRVDNLPTVLIESLAVGTPVVATRVGGIVDIINHGVEGLLAKPGDCVSLADSITLILEDESTARKFSLNARATFSSRFSQTHAIMKHADWYEERLKTAKG